ncbi:MAG TPA: ABC transporter permease [Candidatus Didemnitutus sp.]|nr:ABC transporter permease [Candidatus Didemnitutus sp.]
MLHDLRYAVRSLLKTRGFAIVAVLTLAIGIGANTAIFSVAEALLLTPPDYPDPGRIMVLNETRLPQFPTYPVSGANYLDWKANVKSFAEMGGTTNLALTYTGGQEPQRLKAKRATVSYFSVFGISPLRGRIFSPAEDTEGGRKVTILSYALWQSLFGGQDSVIGRTFLLNGDSYEVIGVMPPSFQESSGIQLWVPMALTADERSDDYRGAHFLEVFGRLRPGVTQAQALQDLVIYNETLRKKYPDSNKSCGATLVSLAESYNQDVRGVLHVLLATVACVLLIACLNVAGLLLARGAARQQEIAVRSALGASRAQLLRQLLTESLMLALAGGVLGVAIAGGSLAALVRLIPVNLPQAHLIALNRPVLGFSLGLSLLTGLVFGLLPAWRATQVDLVRVTKEGSRGNTAGGGRFRLQSLLVAAEVAAAVVLLVGTALLARSFTRLVETDKGFHAEQALMFNLLLSDKKYSTPEKQTAFARELLSQLSGLRGVTAAGLTHRMPLVRDSVLRLIVQGRPPVAKGDLPNTNYYAITPDYLRAFGTPVLRGRGFTDQDREGSTRVALINETFARKFFPGEDPIGQRIQITNGDEAWREIVGIVRDVRSESQGIDHESIPQSYEPYYQQPNEVLYVVLRFTGDERSLFTAVRQKVAALDHDLPIGPMRLIQEVVDTMLARPRFAVTLVSGFSVIALLIAAVGLYAMVTYRVIQQTRDMGIRLALGATPAAVLRKVLRDGMMLVGAGLVVGIGGSLLLTRLLRSLLYETSAQDPAALAAVAFVLALVGLLACWLPARRAARVDPMVALRAE